MLKTVVMLDIFVETDFLWFFDEFFVETNSIYLKLIFL